LCGSSSAVASFDKVLHAGYATIIGGSHEENECEDYDPKKSTDWCIHAHKHCCKTKDDYDKNDDFCEFYGFYDDSEGIVGGTPWTFSAKDVDYNMCGNKKCDDDKTKHHDDDDNDDKHDKKHDDDDDDKHDKHDDNDDDKKKKKDDDKEKKDKKYNNKEKKDKKDDDKEKKDKKEDNKEKKDKKDDDKEKKDKKDNDKGPKPGDFVSTQ
jgi:hypothetical protein